MVDAAYSSSELPGPREQQARKQVTYSAFADLVTVRKEQARDVYKRHLRIAAVERGAAEPLLWLAAVLAALSGLSVVADKGQAAQVLSIATAVVAATNAALNPTESARRHQAAAIGYRRLFRVLHAFLFFEIPNTAEPIPASYLKSMRERLDKLDEEIQALDESSPPLGPKWFRKRPRDIMDDESPVSDAPRDSAGFEPNAPA
jgi:hypothetical protein